MLAAAGGLLDLETRQIGRRQLRHPEIRPGQRRAEHRPLDHAGGVEYGVPLRHATYPAPADLDVTCLADDPTLREVWEELNGLWPAFMSQDPTGGLYHGYLREHRL
ncbi:hypothetical protein Acsp02_20010 [Actinoplanes sp. NBRC 103695]|nr:hypothetical protein Acsp02_20010 [Actinoplanes sp. NBRC 103695]